MRRERNERERGGERKVGKKRGREGERGGQRESEDPLSQG